MDKLISQYLLHSFIYYKLGKNLISDKEYDNITIELLNNFDKVQSSDHIHKHLLTENNLKASTGYDIKFPNIVIDTAHGMIREKEKVTDMNDLF